MRILTTLAMLLAMALPTLGAQTWPAGTNVANIFFRTNQFREATSFGVGHTNIITDAGSKLNGVGFTNQTDWATNFVAVSSVTDPAKAVLSANGANGFLRLYDNGNNFAQLDYDIINGWSFSTSPINGDGSGLTNLQGSFNGNASTATLATNAINATNFWGLLDPTNFPSPLLLDQLNVGTLVLTNPPVLDLSASTNYAGSNVVGAVALATGATNDDLGNKISTTYYKSGSVMNLSVSTNLNGSALFYQTNVNNTTPDFWVPYSLLETNAAFAFLAPVHISLTNAQTAVICVTNTTGVAIAVTPPASVHTQGTWNVTNMSTFTFFNYGGTFTNAIAFPLW